MDAVRGAEVDGGWTDEREGRLWAYAISLGARPDDAADIVQEAFARFSAASVGTVVIQNPEAWLYVTVHRLVVDGGRQRTRLARALSRLAGLRDSRGVVDAPEATGNEVWDAVDGLPTRQRASIYLRYRADLDYGSIAMVLDVSDSAARSYVSKALDELERRLGTTRSEL